MEVSPTVAGEGSCGERARKPEVPVETCLGSGQHLKERDKKKTEKLTQKVGRPKNTSWRLVRTAVRARNSGKKYKISLRGELFLLFF